MLAKTRYEHIILNHAQIPVIEGTTMKVVELVLAQAAYGWSADELREQFPYLTFGQIYSALAYYWDHQEELDANIEGRVRKADSIRKSIPESPLAKRLRGKGLA